MRTLLTERVAISGWRRSLKGWVVLALSCTLFACGGGSSSDTDPSPAAKAHTTVLVYIVGSDLEGERPGGRTGDMATGNLKEMMAVGSTGDVNVIVEMGGAKKAGWETVKRQRVEKGSLQLLSDLGVQRMSDPENLRKFIEWAVKAYPAQNYHLMLWNHGGGPLYGFGSDQNYPDTQMMSMPELQQALEGAKGATGLKLNLIGFDACLMASVEIAQALSPYGNYLVASEEVEPGAGWDWTAYLNHLISHTDRNVAPDEATVLVGKTLIDGYVKKMAEEGQETVTLSLTDLRKVGALTDSLGTLFGAISSQLDASAPAQRFKVWAELAYARRISHDFQTSWFAGSGANLVDIGDFIGMPKLGGMQVTEEQVEAVRQHLEQAVVYERHGDKLWGSSGLTMYFPLVGIQNPDHIYQHYNPLPVPTGLKDIVRHYVTLANSKDWPAPQVGVIQDDTGDVKYAEVQNPAFQAAGYAALWQDDGGTPRMLAMKPLDADMSQDDQDLRQEQTIRIAAHAQSGWLGIAQASGSNKVVPVSVLPDDMPRFDVDAVLQYTIPVSLIPAGTNVLIEGLLMVSAEPEGDPLPNGTRKRVHRIVGFTQSENNPYASRPDTSMPVGSIMYPQRWTADREWASDFSRLEDRIITRSFGDADTPRDQWWTLEPVDVATELCAGGQCKLELGVVDYQGRFQFAQEDERV